jgi:Na+-driven multidrug efflux pump
MDFAVPYLRIRAWGMIPALFAATGFAAYRGLLDTVTPLKVSLGTNAFNLVADPILMFGALGTRGLGMGGAALATAFAETASGLVYLKLLLQKGLVRWSQLLKPPKDWTSIIQLLKGGMAMLARQATLNVAFITAARRAQAMDPSGVSAAAYGTYKSLRHFCFI